MATTIRDLLNDFFQEVVDLKSDQQEGESIPDDDKQALIDEYIETIKNKIVG